MAAACLLESNESMDWPRFRIAVALLDLAREESRHAGLPHAAVRVAAPDSTKALEGWCWAPGVASDNPPYKNSGRFRCSNENRSRGR